MREYFQVHPAERPKIFGMTASPIWNPKDAEGSLLTLEKNLDATVIAVREHVSELLENSPRPVEVRVFSIFRSSLERMLMRLLQIIKEYFPPPDNYLYLNPNLWDTLSLFQSNDVDMSWDKLHMKYHVTRNSLGPYSADLFIYHEVRTRVNQLLLESDPFDVQEDGMDIDDPPASRNTPSIPVALEQVDSILSDFKPFFEDSSTFPLAVPIPVPLAWCTPKVKALTEVLLAYHTPTFHGIVFVEQRQVAACLAKILSKIPELRGRIRCAELVGHGGHGTRNKGGSNASAASAVNVKGMGLARQQDTVRLFRKSYEEGGLNLRAFIFVLLFSVIDSLSSGCHVRR